MHQGSPPGTPDVDRTTRASRLTLAPTGPLVVPLAAPAPALRLSVIVPIYNEANNVREMARALTDVLEGPLEGAYEILFVDDDSPDRGWEAVLALADELPRVRVMRRVGERGLATAVVRGWQASRADVLAVIDGDLQHPAETLLELFRLVERGADLAIASRHVEGGGVSDWSIYRRLVSRGAQLLGLALAPSIVGRVSDPMSGYFMTTRRAIAGRELSPLGYKILVEVLARGDIHTIGEAAYVFRERARGGSKATLRVYLAYLQHLARLRSARRRL